MVVRCSNLALRFYRADGWTEELLRKHLIRGSFVFFDDRVGDADWSYWVMRTDSKLNIDTLKDVVTEVVTFDGNWLSGERAISHMRYLNW